MKKTSKVAVDPADLESQNKQISSEWISRANIMIQTMALVHEETSPIRYLVHPFNLSDKFEKAFILAIKFKRTEIYESFPLGSIQPKISPIETS